MEQKNDKEIEVNKVIASNEKWFRLFSKLPILIAIFWAIASFVLCLVPCGMYGELIFIPLAFFVTPIVWFFNYILFRVLFSYPILHIYYLKKESLKDER